ncbi:MAG TPA: hypothetical protein G4N92_07455 [Anaerolineae bacterium]|nr:hypothetical protein [Anaerolineae bacterium]
MTDENRHDVQKEIKRLEKEIRRVFEKMDESNFNAWLRCIYEQKYKMLSEDTNRIWMIGRIFLPLSLSLFASLFLLDEITLEVIIVFCLISTFLIYFWFVISENLRAFQNKAWSWIIAIEKHVGIKDPGESKVYDNDVNKFFTSKNRIQTIRRLLVWGVIIGWLIIIRLNYIGKI